MTALLLAAGAACESHHDVEAKPYSVEDVRQAFKHATGDELAIKYTARGVPILGDVTGLGVAPELKPRYGNFGIVVFRRLGKKRRAELDGGRRPGKDGIVWQYHPEENEGDVPIWSAGKYYGNVVLTWYHRKRETTEQWKTLDRSLARLTAKSP